MKKNKLIFLILILATILRLGYVFHTRNQGLTFGDAHAYDQLGKSLAEGKGYSDQDGNPTAARAPLYPLLIGIIYFLFGPSLFAVRLFQVILGVLSCYILFLLGRKAYNIPVALIASFLFAWNPYLVYYTGHLLQETLFIFILLITIYLLSYLNEKTRFSLLAGGFAGLAVLTRETFVFYLPFLLVGLLIVIKGDILSKFKKTLLFFFVFSMVWGIWIARNYFVFGSFATRTVFCKGDMGGEIWAHLWYGNNPYLGVDFEKECRYLGFEMPAELASIPPKERGAYAKKKALKLITEDPLRTIKIHIVKFGRFWRLYPHDTKLLGESTKKSFNFLIIISLLSDGWIIPLGLIGLLLFFRKKNLLILLWIMSQCIGITLIFYPMVRYRLPVMPFVMLYTAYFLYALGSFLRTKMQNK